jgi:hypothetical protein
MTIPVDYSNPLTIPPPRSRASVDRRIPALSDGWTAADDLALMEGLFLGHGLGRIASDLGKTLGKVQDRFLQLRRAAVGEGPFTLTAQVMLLEIVRGQVDENNPNGENNEAP